jgi:hypothetical protein
MTPPKPDPVPTTPPRIDRGDIEAKFRELQGEVEIIGEEAKGYGLTVAIALGVGIVALAFVIGRRRGRRNRTFVEVRRI